MDQAVRFQVSAQEIEPSFPRKRESSVVRESHWVPAFAGTTNAPSVPHEQESKLVPENQQVSPFAGTTNVPEAAW
jgi:hypothetical protein